jgi:hypothetical protein
MVAISNKPNEQSPRVGNTVRTTSMGLGLVRLLLDAGRPAEARAALASLQTGLQEPQILPPGEAAGVGPGRN